MSTNLHHTRVGFITGLCSKIKVYISYTSISYTMIHILNTCVHHSTFTFPNIMMYALLMMHALQLVGAWFWNRGVQFNQFLFHLFSNQFQLFFDQFQLQFKLLLIKCYSILSLEIAHACNCPLSWLSLKNLVPMTKDLYDVERSVWCRHRRHVDPP